MTNPQEQKISYAKSSLDKAIKTRLSALIQGLGDAEVGGKGIDLVKEIKELYIMIADLNPSAKAVKQENSKLEVGWAEWENMVDEPKPQKTSKAK